MDEGALRATKRKEVGGRLLPAGVVRIEGPFASHQAVKLFVRRKKRNSASDDTNPGGSIAMVDLSVPPSPIKSHKPLIQTAESSQEVSPNTAPEPGTPSIQPALSLSSSIASLDPLSRSVPPSPAIHALTERMGSTNIDGGVKVVHEPARGEKLPLIEEDQWEEIEVGKGLALYNSSEIDRIKGVKR